MRSKIAKISIAAIAVLGLSASALQADTLSDVQKNGFVKCGVNTGLPGFSSADASGHWSGIDVDVCRAVAAAVLGDASKVKYTPLTAKERFTALQSGEIDILSRNTTWTQTRDSSLGLNFAGVNFYDGQAFMIHKSLGVKSALDLNGAAVCVQAGTTTELNLASYFASHGMKYKSVSYDTTAQVRNGYESGRCDVMTSDSSQLHALQTTLKDPSGSIILPQIISKEPLGPVVRQGDDVWFNIVKWSYNAMVAAEERGITSKNVDQLKATTKDPAIKRILGTEGRLGENLHLKKDWAYNIIKQVGNYGESFERNVGMGSPLKIERGLNAQWKDGGLQYSPPFK
ncbi:amino acid ABC transporter substrate-binding protein [Sulfurospirillum sp. 1612]|uniref:amino acid ABC transporter substrate-binding protein n=1 Tax=Sulfurospirillum sp. 1612 TaxID=3094835 RepID=UPI002F9345E5